MGNFRCNGIETWWCLIDTISARPFTRSGFIRIVSRRKTRLIMNVLGSGGRVFRIFQIKLVFLIRKIGWKCFWIGRDVWCTCFESKQTTRKLITRNLNFRFKLCIQLISHLCRHKYNKHIPSCCNPKNRQQESYRVPLNFERNDSWILHNSLTSWVLVHSPTQIRPRILRWVWKFNKKLWKN